MPPTPWEQITLQARAGVFVNDLPSNRELPNDVTAEALQTGWTVQQPFTHTRCAVPLVCILCGQPLDTRHWTDHLCAVQRILGDFPWTLTT